MARAGCECVMLSPSCCSEHMGKQQEEMAAGNDTQNLEPKTGIHITEALRVQLDVQRRLHEQLEMQRGLQVSIEKQGKRLQEMLEDQLKTSGNSDEESEGGVDARLTRRRPSRTTATSAASVRRLQQL